MATHFLDYKSIEGRITACGRFFDNCKPMPRGVVITDNDSPVSCQLCLGTDRLKLARTTRHRENAERALAPDQKRVKIAGQ